ncbi:MAG: MG2 domain-containing protein [Marinifilaceae bacterium]|jgi:hypothetical protein|nr:MG2 domain-containing protein [Marinifilaceae bacterium]
MRLYLFILLFAICPNLCIGQTENSKLWKKIEELELQEKIKDANLVLDKIIENTNPSSTDYVKSYLYKSKFTNRLSENSVEKTLKQLKKGIDNSEFPNSALLHSIYAQSLAKYYNYYRYRIDNQTELDKSELGGDYKQWDRASFMLNIDYHISKSLERKKILLDLPVTKYSNILTDGRNTINLRPSIYDILAFRAIDIYSDMREFRMVPYIKHKQSFCYVCSTQNLNNHNLNKDDIVDKIISVYKELENYYIDRDVEVYIDVLLNRLEKFNRFYGNSSSKKFLEILEDLSSKFHDSKASGMINYQIGKTLCEQSFEKEINHLRKKDNLIKAHDIFSKIIKEFPYSEAAVLSKLKIKKLEHKSIGIKTEAFVYPNKEFLARVDFKNIEDFNLFFYRIGQKDELFNFNLLSDSAFAKKLNKFKLIEKNQYKLPKKKDYYSHSTEIILPKLESGKYLVISSHKNEINGLKDILSSSVLNVTNISVLKRRLNSNLELKILNRKSGAVYPNIDVRIEEAVDYRSLDKNGLKSDNNRKPLNLLKTDSNGRLIVDLKKYKRKNIRIYLHNDSDTCSFIVYNKHSYFGLNREINKEKKDLRASIFTDRSLYRPGQSLYFKLILFECNRFESNTVADTELRLSLYNANGQKLEDRVLKTNDYGSVSGEFKLPKGDLTGVYSLRIEELNPNDKRRIYARKNIRIEEYKRAKTNFYINSITKTYNINDTVQITGKAESLFGGNNANSTISYQIYCSSQNSWSPKRYYDSKSFIIKTGKVKTDSVGNFKLSFIAKALSENDSINKLNYTYSAKLKFVDQSGETHEKSKAIIIGYRNYSLNYNIPSRIDLNNEPSSSFYTTDLNNVKLKSRIEINLERLILPSRILKPRYWDIPEEQIISKQDFVKHFPYIAYDKYDLKDNWEAKSTVFRQIYDGDKENKIKFNEIKFVKAGCYRFKLKAITQFGDTIEKSNVIEIVDSRNRTITNNLIFDYAFINKDIKKDKNLVCVFRTAYDNLYLNLEAYKDKELIYSDCLNIKSNYSKLKIPIKDVNPGRIQLLFSYVKNNRVYAKKETIELKKENKDLKIETISFRDKIYPGSIEKWSFRIKEDNKLEANAELLASMYDSSLDQIATNIGSYENMWPAELITDVYNSSNVSNYDYYEFFKLNNFHSANLDYVREPVSIFRKYSDLKNYGFGLFYNSNSNYIFKLRNKISKTTIKNTSGFVFASSGQPLKDVKLAIKASSQYVYTDELGFYSIETSAGDTIMISRENCKDHILKIDQPGVYNFILKLNENVDKYGIQYDMSYGGGLRRKSAMVGFAGSVNGLSPGNQQFVDEELEVEDSEEMGSLDEIKVNFTNNETNSPDRFVFNDLELRENLKETAFFYPHLRTNKKGEVEFEFTSPEAMTSWKLMLFAHKKNANSCRLEKGLYTRKKMSIVPDIPRFYRIGDKIVFSAKLNNLTDEDLETGLKLEFFDPISGTDISRKIIVESGFKTGVISRNSSKIIQWNINIPDGLVAVQYKVMAKSEESSDGEQGIIPVLSNKVLITESLALNVAPGKTKLYNFENMLSNNSKTLKNHKLTFEYTANMSWTVLKTLPYMMESFNESSDETFARLYANLLAQDLIRKNPDIKKQIDIWKEKSLLESPLNMNQELKTSLISETPWFRDLLSDDQNHQKLSFMFNSNNLKDQLNRTRRQLSALQLPSGAFPWFKGGSPNSYITRNILLGFGQLLKYGILDNSNDKMIKLALSYLDSEYINKFKFGAKKDQSKFMLRRDIVHYFYVRSFFFDKYPMSKDLSTSHKLFLESVKKYGLDKDLYSKSMIGIILCRSNERILAKKILEAFKQTSVDSEENGIYWKSNIASWHWYQDPIVVQSLILQMFNELDPNSKLITGIKKYILKSKKLHSWNSNRAASEAIYSLLSSNKTNLNAKEHYDIEIGENKFSIDKNTAQASNSITNYVKKSWNSNQINNSMSEIKIKNKGESIGFGAVYWQYFENIDQVKSSLNNPLQIKKQVFIRKIVDSKEKLIPVENQEIKLGDKICVRIVLKLSDELNYLHLKDLRPAGCEPVEQYSGYKHKPYGSYYQSVKDASINFYFDSLAKGTYVFEYDLYANDIGEYTTGYAKVQSYYAPEYNANSKSSRINISE